jgi:acetolactate synthase-1/3 small subunit
MSEAQILARLRDRPGALERAIGLIRRRAHAIRRLSVASTADGEIEIVLRVDEARTSSERVCRDLLALEDLVEVRDLAGGEPPLTRELLLAWIRPEAAPRATVAGRIVAYSAQGCLLEATGTPDEIDALLAQLDEHGMVAASVRSGEVAAPDFGNTVNPSRSQS